MKILVIEDDPDIREFVRQGLLEEGYIVETVDNGEKGSYIARTNYFDLIILDILLPAKNGLEVCQEIRKSGKSTPILILSVEDDVPLKVDLLESGADDYMTKPFSFKELLARISALGRRPKQIEDDMIAADDLVLDTRRQQAWRNNKHIYLTHKEFLLLEYLLKNKNRVLSRAMIMDNIWNLDCDPFSNTIEVHILNLRRKIDGGRNIKLIHTVPRRGYKIETKHS
jgi:DNA-binding response OmpR family regulator